LTTFGLFSFICSVCTVHT